MVGFNIERAVNFLLTRMYVPINKLFIESTKTGGGKHYISSANCIAASAVRPYNMQISNDCIAQIKAIKTRLGKPNIKSYWQPAMHPTVRNIVGVNYAELGTTEEFWTTMNGHDVVCNISRSGTINCATESYANRAMLHALYQLQHYASGSTAIAQACIQRAFKFWDGKGFNDVVGPTHYDSFKTGLGIYCMRFPELRAAVPNFVVPQNLFDGIQNQSNGGVYGRYYYNSSTNKFYVESTYENTEATCLCLMAYSQCFNCV